MAAMWCIRIVLQFLNKVLKAYDCLLYTSDAADE